MTTIFAKLVDLAGVVTGNRVVENPKTTVTAGFQATSSADSTRCIGAALSLVPINNGVILYVQNDSAYDLHYNFGVATTDYPKLGAGEDMWFPEMRRGKADDLEIIRIGANDVTLRWMAFS